MPSPSSIPERTCRRTHSRGRSRRLTLQIPEGLCFPQKLSIPYDSLSEPYGAAARWLADHGEKPALPVREVYLAKDEGKPPVTEIQYPLGAAS